MATLEERHKKLKQYAKLRRLTTARAPQKPSAKEVEATFSRFAQQLQKSGELAHVSVQLTGGRKKQTWGVVLAEDTSKVSRKAPASLSPGAAAVLA